jgi:hypothetical protein
MSPTGSCACCKARFIKFRLLGAITRSDYRQVAKVLAFWDGDNPEVANETFYVYNLVLTTDNDDQPTEDQGPSQWAYAADDGTTGYAILDEENKIAGLDSNSNPIVIDPPNYRIVEIPATVNVRRFILRSDLEEGQTAVAEMQVLVPGTLQLMNTGIFFCVFDPFCEFHGAQDSAWGYALRIRDTPDSSGSPPAGSTNPTSGEVIWEIARLTCPDFLGCNYGS